MNMDDVRNRVADKMDEFAGKMEAKEEITETVEDAKTYIRDYAYEIKKVGYVLCVFLAASYGARYGVTRALANGRIKIKK